MKSAYELALERLDREDPDSRINLSEEQKQQLAELDRRYEAQKAERTVFLSGQLEKARNSGDQEEVAQLERQLHDENLRLDEEKEGEKEKIRNAPS